MAEHTTLQRSWLKNELAKEIATSNSSREEKTLAVGPGSGTEIETEVLGKRTGGSGRGGSFSTREVISIKERWT